MWIFGSRVSGNAKPFSDLDLAIISPQPLSLDTRAALADDFRKIIASHKVVLVPA